MKDRDFLKLCKQMRTELHRRYGTQVCKELDIGCGDCKVRILVGILNDQISLNEWAIKKR